MDVELAAEVREKISTLTCDYAFYCHPRNGEPLLIKNRDLFFSASIIKAPILFAWAYLERNGRASRDEICELDLEPQVQGAGLSWLLQTRRLPFGDVLLLMIALIGQPVHQPGDPADRHRAVERHLPGAAGAAGRPDRTPAVRLRRACAGP